MHCIPSYLLKHFHILNANIRCKAITETCTFNSIGHLKKFGSTIQKSQFFRKSWESKQVLRDKVHSKYSHLLQITPVKTNKQKSLE